MDDLSRYRAPDEGKTNKAAGNSRHTGINRTAASQLARANFCLQSHVLTSSKPQSFDDISRPSATQKLKRGGVVKSNPHGLHVFYSLGRLSHSMMRGRA